MIKVVDSGGPKPNFLCDRAILTTLYPTGRGGSELGAEIGGTNA